MANIEAKQALVDQLKEKIQNSKSVVFLNYCGLTVEQDTNMRREFRENGVEYKVLKNTLIKRALNELNLQGFDEDLNGPTAVAFSVNDEISAPRIVQKNVESTKKLQIKSGLMNNARLDGNGVSTLATIPSKEILLAQLLWTIKAPISKMAIALKAIADQKN